MGLYKLTAVIDGTTAWYDGNPSTFRHWDTGEPDHFAACVRYVRSGFRDHPCHKEFYYTCKKAAGNLYAIVTIVLTMYFYSVYFT